MSHVIADPEGRYVCAHFELLELPPILLCSTYFGVGGEPTGSKDPYALRRQTLGVIRIVLVHKLDINVEECLAKAREGLQESGRLLEEYHFDITKVYDYMLERLTHYYQEIGIESDIVRAVRGREG